MPLPGAKEEEVRAIIDRMEVLYGRIARACQRSGRREDAITLVGVTKTHPLETIAAALESGLRDLGENKAQELNTKASTTPPGACRWHMVGHLQRNKARIVACHAHLFHALDSVRLADSLERVARQEGRILPCLVQVNVSGESTKFGLVPQDVPKVLDTLMSHEHLRIQGLMTLASPTANPEAVRPQFRQLRQLLDVVPYPEMRLLSMGMSGDFEVAIEEGATHIRIGSAIFGPRNAEKRI